MAARFARCLPQLLPALQPRGIGCMHGTSSCQAAIQTAFMQYAEPRKLQADATFWGMGFSAGYAKSSKGDQAALSPQAIEATVEAALEQSSTLMRRAVEHLGGELGKLHMGRASPAMLEVLSVEVARDRVPLRRLAAVTVQDHHTLLVSVYEKQNVGAVLDAISKSPLQLSVRAEGDSELVVPVPRLSAEACEGLMKVAHLEAEKARVTIKNAKKKAADALKVIKNMDFKRRVEKEMDKQFESFMSEVEKLKKQKDNDIRAYK